MGHHVITGIFELLQKDIVITSIYFHSTSMLLKLPCHQETNYAAQRISDHIVRLGKPQAGGKLGGLDKQCQGEGKPEDFPLRTEAVKSCSQWNKQPDIIDDLCANCVFQCKLFQIREGYQSRSWVAGFPEHQSLMENEHHIGRQQQSTGFRRKQRHADAQQHTDHSYHELEHSQTGQAEPHGVCAVQRYSVAGILPAEVEGQ